MSDCFIPVPTLFSFLLNRCAYSVVLHLDAGLMLSELSCMLHAGTEV
jgi:hypothetical protein